MSLKILLVSEYFPPHIRGGGELSAELLAHNLQKVGHEVHVLTSADDSGYRLEGVRLHRILSTAMTPNRLSNVWKRMWILPRRMAKEVMRLDNEETFDVIHYLNAVSLLSARKNDTRQFATINSYQPFCPKGNLFYRDKMPCSGCNPVKFTLCLPFSRFAGKMKLPILVRYNPLAMIAIYFNYLRFRRGLRRVIPVAVSSFVGYHVSRIVGRSPVVIPNFPRKIDVRAKTVDSRVRVLYLGSLERFKGVDLLLQAFLALPRQVSDMSRLDLVGDGSLLKEMDKNATENVKFHGRLDRDKVYALLAASDIVVVPSLWPEPLSRVLLEAASLGKAIIATDVGGSKDVLGNTGGMLIPSDRESLVEALKLLIMNESRRESLGRRVKMRFEKEFRVEKILDSLTDLYNHKDYQDPSKP